MSSKEDLCHSHTNINVHVTHHMCIYYVNIYMHSCSHINLYMTDLNVFLSEFGFLLFF